MSDIYCERIVNNIEALGRELFDLRNDRNREQFSLDGLRRSLANEVQRGNDGGSGIGRRPSRRREGIGLDIISAIGQVISNDNSAKIAQIQRDIAEAERNLARLEAAISENERLVSDQQSEFIRFDCYAQGHRHEVLNIRSVPPPRSHVA